MKRSCVLVLVGVLALLGPLAGCSDGDPEPKIAPTDSSSAASSTSPSPSPSGPVEPGLPAEAEGEDAAAAEAFVRFYWEMVNYAQATGDTRLLATLETPTCQACIGGRESIEATYANDGVIEGGVSQVLDATATRLNAHSKVAMGVRATVRMSPQVVRIPGEKPSRNEGGDYEFSFVVEHDGKWRVARWEIDL